MRSLSHTVCCFYHWQAHLNRFEHVWGDFFSNLDDAHICLFATAADVLLLLLPLVPGVSARGGGGARLLLQVTRRHPLARGRVLEASRGQEDPCHRGCGGVGGAWGGGRWSSAREGSGKWESRILNSDDLTSGGWENLRGKIEMKDETFWEKLKLT